MFYSDDQRKWWFATHPEYSSSARAGHKSQEALERRVEKLSAEIRNEKAQSKQKSSSFWDYIPWINDSPARKTYAEMTDEERREDYERTKLLGLEADPHTFLDVVPYRPRQQNESAGTYAEMTDEERREDFERNKELGLPETHTWLDVPGGVTQMATAPIKFLKYALGGQTRGAVVYAVKKGVKLPKKIPPVKIPNKLPQPGPKKIPDLRGRNLPDQGPKKIPDLRGRKLMDQGPGEWKEVGRSYRGLEHQSKMSGKKIIIRNGKYKIKEYYYNGVYFDNYKYGALYEYKGKYGRLINKEGYFYRSFRGAKAAQAQAERQVKAAQGMPVVWQVGANQVKAFKKAVGQKKGLIIIP